MTGRVHFKYNLLKFVINFESSIFRKFETQKRQKIEAKVENTRN